MKNIRWSLGALLLAASCAALAQYKVVGPDGKVTYTDTPPPTSSGSKVTKLGDRVSVIPQVALPLELREAATRYPVTLYTMRTCEPCDQARQHLRQRGVPYTEKVLVTGDDGDTLQRTTGGREVPTVTIGAQVLRGFAAENWNSYLDNAGYPRESRLPANYQQPAATPMSEPAAPPAPATAQRRAAPQDTQPVERMPSQTTNPSGIKF